MNLAGEHIEILFVWGWGVNTLCTDCTVKIFLDRLSTTKHNFSWTDFFLLNNNFGPNQKLLGGGVSPHTLPNVRPRSLDILKDGILQKGGNKNSEILCMLWIWTTKFEV